nr:hypothetical protein [Tanacetum cinerariifolium]GEY73347.1 hypothetical protein [Tanacetum cinerariifolium]
MIPVVVPDDVPTIVPVVPETEATVVASLAEVLDLVTYSSIETDPFEDPPSLVHVPAAPITSSFLSSDSFEPSRDYSDSDSFERPPRPDSHETVPLSHPFESPPSSSSEVSSHSSSDTTRTPSRPYPHRRPQCLKYITPSSSTFAGPSQKRRRSLATSVLVGAHPPRALSPVRADLLLPRKRLRDSSFAYRHEVTVEVSTKMDIQDSIETGIEGDIKRDIEDSNETYIEPDIDSDILANIKVDLAVEAAKAIEANTMEDDVVAVEAEVEPVQAGSEPVEAEVDVEPSAEDTICWELYFELIRQNMNEIRWKQKGPKL